MKALQRRALTNGLVAGLATLLLGIVIVDLLPNHGERPTASVTPGPKPPPACAPSWEALPSPDPQDGGSLLLGIAMVTPTDGWAVGGAGDPESPTATLTVRWDGTAWTLVTSPNPGSVGNVLTAVTALSRDAAWAVGSATDGLGEHPVAILWDGAGWNLLPLPPDLGEGALSGVVALARNDVWAVGYTGDPELGTERALAIHWDGTAWDRAPLRTVIGGGRSRLLGISASGPDDVVAIGVHRNRPVVVRYDGSAWSAQPVDVPGDLDAAVTLGASDAWAVGTSIARWDGQSWSEAGAVRAQGTLHAIAAGSPHDVWAVGERPSGHGDLKALVQRWDGQGWAIVKGGGAAGSATLTSVSALPDGTFLAVGYHDVHDGRSTLAIRGSTCG